MVAPRYPKGDLRRMLAVLGAIETGSNTLAQVTATAIAADLLDDARDAADSL